MNRLAPHWFRNDLRLADDTAPAEAADAQLGLMSWCRC